VNIRDLDDPVRRMIGRHKNVDLPRVRTQSKDLRSRNPKIVNARRRPNCWAAVKGGNAHDTAGEQ
jgi:hypothetical protein